jgi:hypothetical protein
MLYNKGRSTQTNEQTGAKQMATENHNRYYFLFDDARKVRSANRNLILDIIGDAYDNACDTIRIDKAAPAADWDVLFVGTIQSQLSQGVNRHIKTWFANRGITY